MCVYMYMHVYMYIHTYIYTHMYIHWYNTHIHNKYVNLASKDGFSKVRAIIYSFNKYLGATVC